MMKFIETDQQQQPSRERERESERYGEEEAQQRHTPESVVCKYFKYVQMQEHIEAIVYVCVQRERRRSVVRWHCE